MSEVPLYREVDLARVPLLDTPQDTGHTTHDTRHTIQDTPEDTRYRGYSKLRTHTALGPYSSSIPRSI